MCACWDWIDENGLRVYMHGVLYDVAIGKRGAIFGEREIPRLSMVQPMGGGLLPEGWVVLCAIKVVTIARIVVLFCESN